MAWFALDDGFDTHPKVRKAGNAAVGLFVRLGVHATRHLTEGHLDGDIVRQYGTEPNVRKLVAVGMLHPSGHACPRCPQPADGDYVIHDYLDYNKSRAQIEAAREAARKRQQKGRDTARSNRNRAGNGAESSSIRSGNEADSTRNRPRKDPLFEDSAAGQGDLSRRDTHEGATVVPSPPLPSPNYAGADVGGVPTGSSAPDLDAYAPTPIEIDGFQLTDYMRRWCAATYPNLDIEHSTAQFVSHYRSTGARRKSWPDAWQKWIRDDAQREAGRGQRPALRALTGGYPTREDAALAKRNASRDFLDQLAEQLRQGGTA